MSQRESGYARKERDLYETPEWVTAALCPHLHCDIRHIWEPAAGSGQMARALQATGRNVVSTDIVTGEDFLTTYMRGPFDAIVTNPPYVLAKEFIERALSLPTRVVAMLLRTDYDHAKTRAHLFAGCPTFSKKLVLTKRIVWFAGPKAAPSFNHAWYIWDKFHSGPPTLAYDV